jgi:hypothetical protein
MDSETAHEWPALTVRQPWAELLISGRKSIEIRSKAPQYRGRMWLHAGLKNYPELEREFGFEHLYRGGFVGSIQLVGVVPLTKERWVLWRDNHLDLGEYRSGFFAWMIAAPRRFQIPVRGKGQLGLFYPPVDLVQQLERSEEELQTRAQDGVL